MTTWPCDVKNCPAVVAHPTQRYCTVHRAMTPEQRAEAHAEAERKQFNLRTLKPVTDRIGYEKP